MEMILKSDLAKNASFKSYGITRLPQQPLATMYYWLL